MSTGGTRGRALSTHTRWLCGTGGQLGQSTRTPAGASQASVPRAKGRWAGRRQALVGTGPLGGVSSILSLGAACRALSRDAAKPELCLCRWQETGNLYEGGNVEPQRGPRRGLSTSGAYLPLPPPGTCKSSPTLRCLIGVLALPAAHCPSCLPRPAPGTRALPRLLEGTCSHSGTSFH